MMGFSISPWEHIDWQGGTTEISVGEISRKTLDCKDSFPIETIWDTWGIYVYASEAGKEVICETLFCVLIIINETADFACFLLWVFEFR